MKTQMKTRITSPSMENNIVRWWDGIKKEYWNWHWLQNKETKKILLVRCPSCYFDNFKKTISSGRCEWCRFNPNKEQLI